MDEVLLGLQNKIHKTGAKITMEFNVVEVLTYKTNIRIILYNLLSNAIKFKSPKRKPEIKVKTTIYGDKVLLEVEDNGIGIRDEMKNNIFTKFGRCTKDVQGTGMGLYIVKKMAEDMGGIVEVESIFGKGSTFKLYFKKGEY